MPELRQAFGDRARQILSQLSLERRVVIRVTGTDRNRRVIAHVFVGGQHVNSEMIRRGAACVFVGHSNDPARLQRETQAAGRGLWVLSERQQVPPWQWRARRQ